MKTRKTSARYVICVRNQDCDDLMLRKVYQILPDEKAEAEGHIRIVDESGEDYLYPADNFLPIELPRPVEEALAGVS